MKKILTLVLFICMTKYSMAQFGKTPTRSAGGNIYVGGDFGFNYGTTNGLTVLSAEVSPVIGYKFTDEFSAGPGVILQYRNIVGTNINQTTYNYGIRAFARYQILPQAFVHAEPQLINVDKGTFSFAETGQRINVPTFLLGAGYVQSVSGNVAFTFSLLYDLAQNKYSPYANSVPPFLVLRVGGNIAF